MSKVRVFAEVTGAVLGVLAAVTLLAGPATGPAAAAAPTRSAGVPVQQLTDGCVFLGCAAGLA